MAQENKPVSLSAVVPVHNEQGNVKNLAEEIYAVAAECGIKEIIFVDDCSTDETVSRLRELHRTIPILTVLQHKSQCGQSAAIYSGISHAGTDWVVTMDGDGQNDPADIPHMMDALQRCGNPNVKLVNGNRNRKANRKDSFIKRYSSKIANAVRSAMLRDNIPDSGCGLKLMHRDTWMKLPYFNNIHRFTPALFLRTDADLLSVDVSHRPRASGSSHYGIWNRLWIGIVDLLGVSWLMRKGYKARLIHDDQ